MNLYGGLKHKGAIWAAVCVLTGFGVLFQGGCTSQGLFPRQVSSSEFVPWSDEVPPRRLGGGDEFDIRFLLTPELNAKATVGSDGRATVPLLGAVRAGGLTVSELEAELDKSYAGTLKDPNITILITRYASDKIYVGGEVKEPGAKDMTGRIDVAQGVTLAGGVLDTATLDQIIVLRRRWSDNKPMIRTVDLNNFVSTGASADDFPLLPGDVVYVPKSGIADANLFIEQYVTNMLPFSRNLNYDLRDGSGY
ncbi:MAG: polysaccharide export protein [Parvibaculaceae bacterium]|nr:polysaccharide export protein [Parvibaculaceae bacterium]